MRQRTIQKLERVSGLLAAHENSYMFAEFPPGAPDPASQDEHPPDLRELLSFSNAPRAGSIALLKDALIPANQFYLDTPGVERIVEGSHESWLVFGTCFDFPLLLRRDDGTVWHFPDYEREHLTESEFRRLAIDLDEFLVDYMLGARYRELTGAQTSGGSSRSRTAWREAERLRWAAVHAKHIAFARPAFSGGRHRIGDRDPLALIALGAIPERSMYYCLDGGGGAPHRGRGDRP